MRQFDLAPLYRNTVGFDRLFSMLDQLVSVDAAPTYPPYNIERTGENAYRISIAVAGFTDQDLSIEVKENTLSVRGERKASEERKAEVLLPGHRGAQLRAPLPARRRRSGDGRGARERPAAPRSRAGDPRGQEAAADPDRAPAVRPRRSRPRSSRPRKASCVSVDESAPGFPGRFFCWAIA